MNTLRQLIVCVILLPVAIVSQPLLFLHELTHDDVARINLHDGDVGDWLTVIGEPTITAADLPRRWPDYNPLDFDFRIWFAWTADPPRIYGAMERIDDIFINRTIAGYPSWYEFLGNDGTLHFLVDGDHSGGQYHSTGLPQGRSVELRRNNLQAQYYVVGVPVGSTARYLDLPGYDYPTDWFLHPPWADGGGRSFSEDPAISVTEFYFTPFDEFVYDNPEASVVSALGAQTVIGLDLRIYDYDFDRPNNSAPSASFFLSPSVGTIWYDSTGWPDAILLPANYHQSIDGESPNLERQGWAAVKSGQR